MSELHPGIKALVATAVMLSLSLTGAYLATYPARNDKDTIERILSDFRAGRLIQVESCDPNGTVIVQLTHSEQERWKSRIEAFEWEGPGDLGQRRSRRDIVGFVTVDPGTPREQYMILYATRYDSTETILDFTDPSRLPVDFVAYSDERAFYLR